MKSAVKLAWVAGTGLVLLSGVVARTQASQPTDPTARASVVAIAPVAPCAVTGKMTDGVAAKGEALYTKKCAICHGATGDGKGRAIKTLAVKPAPWDTQRWAKTTDVEKFKSTKCGGSAIGMSDDMPDYPEYTDQQIWDMLAYSKTLVSK